MSVPFTPDGSAATTPLEGSNLPSSASVTASDASSITSVDLSPSSEDLDDIWSRNAFVPEQVQGCVHDLISDIAKSQPEALAVCAWDGNFTYSQLDSLADYVAHSLVELGTDAKSTVPILFSKSRWTSVAMLGVIKAGCSAVALDATQPNQRLQSIVDQVQPQAMISSPEHRQRAATLAQVPLLQLDDSLEALDLSSKSSYPLPTVSPSDFVYISFTSGTTGQPKGACISHANVRSATFYQGEKLGFHRDSRVFDFAPYSFDVAWSNFLHTLCAGGCLCVASEPDMLSDLSSTITAYNATLVNVTPTVLRTISPIPDTLKSVLLSGEMPYRENVTQWAGRVRLLNTYGPTECTFKCAFSVLDPSSEERPDLGTGVAFSTWIVDPDDGDKLLSTGSVGELYLEGPLVGQGYLSDPEKTDAAFIKNPKWLLAGSKKFPGRNGRLYKTGDLAKYKPDGKLLFIGRKDASQLKIRGQRVEIGDVEHHVRAALEDSLQIIVDVITPQGSENRSLGLFVQLDGQDTEQVKAKMDGLSEKLREVLPAFMIPTIYFPVEKIPVAATGKSDRRRLRETASALTWEEIFTTQSTILSTTQYTAPATDVEEKLRDIWAVTLSLEPSRISTGDSFLRLGGDSIAAMLVVAAAREKSLSLKVADLFTRPILRDLAQVAGHLDPSLDDDEIEPFSLLIEKTDPQSVCGSAARLCDTGADTIQDVYPCTPLQQGMLAMTVRNQKVPQSGRTSSSHLSANYVSRTAFELPGNTNLTQFEKAWSKVVTDTPITRTRIIDLPGEGLVQVVVDDDLPISRYTSLTAFLADAKPMGLGTRLCRAGVIIDGRTKEKDHDTCHFVLEMHHAIFDRWCTVLIMDAVEASYREDETYHALRVFQPFIKHVLATSDTDSAAFWKTQLSDSGATAFPPPSFIPKEKLDLDHTIQGLQWPTTGITPASAVRSALALLLASYTNSDDVLFGATVSGRQAPVPGIERIAGPTIGAVPVRVKFNGDLTVEGLQHQLQRQAMELADFEHYGLQNIQRISKNIEDASRFQTLLVVQAAVQGESEKEGGLFSNAKTVVTSGSEPILVTKDGKADSMGIYNSYAVMVICYLEPSGISVKINYDTGAIAENEAYRLSRQFEYLLRVMCAETQAHSKLSEITSLTSDDLEQIWDWNRTLPQTTRDRVTDLVDQRAVTSPEALAVSSWDQQLTYKQLKDLSSSLSGKFQSRGILPGSTIVLSFEKSSWLIVSMLAALKANVVALPTSSACSKQRAQDIVESLQPKLALVSGSADSSPFNDLITTITISDLTASENEAPYLAEQQHLTSDPALVLFTSGSTGVPKAILWNHGNLSSNIDAAVKSFDFGASTKVFQFAGYEFDVSTVEALTTLVAGGCLHVPSESDRTNRLTEAIHESEATFLGLTPSVSETLSPEALPSLKTMVFAGEKLQRKTALRWLDSFKTVYNWYGPAEASVATTLPVSQDLWTNGGIGRSQSNLTWLVEPRNPHALAPIGAIAELCIEGPIVATYTGKSGRSLNEASFFTPQFLQKGHQNIPGRDGRLYKTGDLVKYSEKGDIVFIGRKQDSQRKLRGQRVDLSDIELQVQSFLSGKLETTVVAEIFTPSSSDKETLALFVSPTKTLEESDEVVGFIKRVLPVDDLEEDLVTHLPSHMIPKVYVPIANIPFTHSGKADRRRLRQIGSALTYEQLAAMQPSRQESRKPTTEMEIRMQKLWAEIIGIEEQAISANDNFLRLGGDSITAMRLVATARNQGLSLTVADVFEAPQLEALAKRMTHDDESDEEVVLPFSLLEDGITESEAQSQAALLCSVPESSIQDVFPCTGLQEGLLALGARRHGQYVSRSVLGLQPNIDTERLQKAWVATAEKLPSLRTRIVDFPGQGLVQVVTDVNPMRPISDLETYLEADESEPMGLGTELCRVALIDRNFILTIHHCTYDGNVLKMILNEFEAQYHGEGGMPVTPFQNFIQYLNKIDSEESTGFWKNQLSNLEPTQYPALPSQAYEPKANEDVEHHISLDWPQNEMTASTIIRSVWSILTAQHTAASDVIFGVTVSGRQANLRGVENCVGPTISTVPLAVSIDWDETVDSFLRRTQQQAVGMTRHEQYGLQNIQRLTGSQDSLLQTLLVVQPVAEGKALHKDSHLFKARTFASTLETRGTDPFNAYALMVICELETSGLTLRLSFDNNIVDGKQMHYVASQFETIIKQLCNESLASTKLDSIQTAGELDLNRLWRQNATCPAPPTETVPELFASIVEKQPDSIAIDAWDGQFTYGELDSLSTTLAQALMSQGLVKGTVVALNFEKSKYAPVAQLAGLKSGGVILMQSKDVPEERIARVYKKAGVEMAIAYESRVPVVSKYARCFTVPQLLGTALTENLPRFPEIRMTDPAAILVSSGSTGEPKQILWSHASTVANLRSTSQLLSLDGSSRIFQFASYDFDIHTLEVLTSLIKGACICIPSEYDRINALVESINRFQPNHVCCTPSTGKLLSPSDIPSVKNMVFGGENLPREDVLRWEGKARVVNWWGPAEASSGSAALADTDEWYGGVIGQPTWPNPALIWLLDPKNPHRLAPIGAVGELAVEGPTLAIGYVGNEMMTKAKFFEGPGFLSQGHASTNNPGRYGRIYRTGDLARYDSAGNLIYIGRQDTQLKIRGQLVAPQEVEKNVMVTLGLAEDIRVVVDAVTLPNNSTVTLVAFITAPTQSDAEELTAGLNDQLKLVLPSYAIPTYYIAVPSIPTAATGKVDRRKLLVIGASFEPPRQGSNGRWQEPVTTAERSLRGLWATVLALEAENISTNDSFLRVGDSIQAMRLVGVARQQGLQLSVAEVFKHPVLKEMATLLRNEDNKEDAIDPFTLLEARGGIDLILQNAATLCKIAQDDIEDIFPCTSLQEGLLALTMKTNGHYTGRNLLELAPSTNLAQFKQAWEKVIDTIPILRTRIIDLPGEGLVQAIIRGHDSWTEASDIDDYLKKEKENPMGLGDALMKWGLFTSGESSYFALTMHHSIYDGLTLPLLMEALESYYNGITPLRHSPFQSFVRYMRNQDKNAETEFWKFQFEGHEAAQFPALPSSTYQPQTDGAFVHMVQDITWRKDDITRSTLIRTAFSLLCSQYTNSPDVIFGTVVDGRKAAVGGIERLAGPTIATIPIRIKVDSQDKVINHLTAIQNQATDMIAYEQTGLSKIRQVSEEAHQACQFQTMVVVQPVEKNVKDSTLFVPEKSGVVAAGDVRRYQEFNSYALSIVCNLDGDQLKVEFSFDSATINNDTVSLMAQHFDQLLKKLCTQELDNTMVCDINMTTTQDLNRIWHWNSDAPTTSERCFHHIFADSVREHPNEVAVTGWDGELTYAQLDAASTNLAHRLIDLGIQKNKFVPLCFEKSVLALVALLGVMKAGGAWVLLDPTLPDSRLESIVQQVEPTLIVSSSTNQMKATKLVKNMLVLNSEEGLVATTSIADRDLPDVDPSDYLYAVFTSGSTGTPKGCLIQHKNFSSAVTLQKEYIGFGVGSRVYDFSSYTFDATYWSTFHALAAGSTLCVPSEVERKSNLGESIRKFGTTHIFFTPSTARLVEPESLPTVERIYIGGEEVTKDDVSRWMPRTTVTITYGPSECSAITVYWNVPYPMPPKLSIGTGIGAPIWVVDPRSSERLAPVGTVGELYLEGPLVGLGYLNNEEKTSASFIRDPAWLFNGSPDGAVAGRRGALYKTGDLVKLDPVSGDLFFVGRKDTQVKLRGQRIELSEVEHHARKSLSLRLSGKRTTVAEVVTPAVTGRAALVVFVELEADQHHKIMERADELEDELSERLPSYMVPAAFIPIEDMPLAVSGKTDRRRLRELGAAITLEQLGGVSDRSTEAVELTGSQLLLQTLWATVLGLPADKIRPETSFLRLGGDSISAMRLAVMARSHNISLTVQSILKAPRLSEMAKFMDTLHEDVIVEDVDVEPFSLLKSPGDKGKAIQYVSTHCNVAISDVLDIFPCTGVQKSLLSMTAKSANSYIARFALRLRDGVDLERLKKAWRVASQATAPILRYRIIDVPKEGLVQVELNDPVEFETYDSLEDYLKVDQTRPMGLALPLTRLSLVKGTNSGETCCVLTQHHAIYDGYSLNLLLTEVSNIYSGIADDSSVAPFQAFIKHVVNVDKDEAKTFWQNQFAGSEAVPFPALPEETYQPKADSTVKRDIADFHWPERDETPSTLIRAAWSILTARYTDTHDAVFGSMVTGRQAPLPGINRMIAPLINAVPVRVKFEPEQKVDELLRDIQQQSIDMITYEQTELLDIRRIDANTDRGTRFNTLLVVQPPSPDNYGEQSDGPFEHRFEAVSGNGDLDDFNPNAVMVMCQLSNSDNLKLEVSFDSNVVETKQMERIVSQFEHILRQLCLSNAEKVEDIDGASPGDIETLWSWNSPLPTAITECVHDLIGKMVKMQPESPAICAWDGDFTYTELNELSSRLALHLVSLGVGPGTRVPLCFEKSRWYPVAALAAMRAGAACIAMDSTQPESRLKSIVNQVEPALLLSSPTTKDLAKQLSDVDVVVVDHEHIQQYSAELETVALPQVSSSDILYVVFTSGSTGLPKGIITTHENYASAAVHMKDILHIERGTRVFDFVSYNFDVSWSLLLQTLTWGGCLCIPSEWERKNDITGALNRMNCDYTYFTPSVAQALDPASMPNLKTLTMGGELIRSTEVARWTQTDNVIGIYGPAECAQALTFARLTGESRNGHVGTAYGARTWLVQPGRVDRLAAIGTIGELVIEGPTVSKGYFGNATKTTESYIRDPCWLTQGAKGIAGRQGTVYKTGDLLRYNSDGSLDFIGRKDGLIKLRGQRIELAEVEYHVRSSLGENVHLYKGIAAEIIIPQDSKSPILVVFLSLNEEGATSADGVARSMKTLEKMEATLSDRVPVYMLPAAYIHLDKIPMTTTNKTDRKGLRELGAKISQKQLAQLQTQGRFQRSPSTKMEKRLQALWSTVLDIDASTISAESSFFRIGGESIAAMRLVAAAREENLSVTVADIFKAPRLSKLAELIAVAGEKEEELMSHEPFSLLNTSDVDGFIQEFVQPVTGADKSTIKDIVPATDFQERAVLDALQDPPGRYPSWIFDLPSDVDFTRLQEACVNLVGYYDILYTVFIKAHGSFWQVSLSNLTPQYDTFDSQSNDVKAFADALCEEDVKRRRWLGESFVRFVAIKHDSGSHKLVLRISHALFDGYTWGKVIETLSAMYNQESLPTPSTFSQYLSFSATKKEESLQYWASRLESAAFPSWSQSGSGEYSPEDRLNITQTITMPDRFEGQSPATIFHAACALVLSRQFNQNEVVFGRLLTGRAMLPGNLQGVVGPTMTEVPVRVAITAGNTLTEVAAQMQEQFIEDSLHEAAGMNEIIRNCTNWPEEASDFGWRTSFQQEDEMDFNFLGAPSKISFYMGTLPARNRPEIYATPRDGKLELEFEGNKKVTSECVVREFMAQLEVVLNEM